MDWQLQDAKNRFSEVVQRACTEGPQVVTLHGKRKAIVLSAEAYDELTPKHPSIADCFLSGPAWSDDLVEAIEARSKTPSRRTAF
jgi:prevent-host-death family protein